MARSWWAASSTTPTTTGALFSATWNQAANAPVAGTSTQLTAAGTGWASRAMFLYQAAPGN